MDAKGFRATHKLSPREMEVALAIGRGVSNRQAGVDLHITEKSIKFHLTNIYKKIGIKSRTQLLLLLSHAGLIHLAPEPQLQGAKVAHVFHVRQSTLPQGA